MQFITPRFTNVLLNQQGKEETAKLYQNKKVMRLIGEPLSQLQSEGVANTFIRANEKPWPAQKVWSITCNQTQTFCGIQMLCKSVVENTAEIGIILAPSMNGKGAAREAMGGLVEFGLANLNLHEIIAQFKKRHLATKRLVTQLNFKQSNDKRIVSNNPDLVTYTFKQ
ncbi:GNAT family N-acetyltransferase [Alteromonas gracilis]|uniref:GNAT family N-acetyltransferase n=1 Tax=Alteromonas gracilis TaxID=1479524 RepID=UPI003735584F